MMKTISLMLSLLALMSFAGCYYDNEEELYPEVPGLVCDTVDVSYVNTVKPILEANCINCHEGNFPSGNVLLDTYAEVAKSANNGSLYGVLSGNPAYSAMPPSGAKLRDCDIRKIKSWIDDGARER
jgi:hypothetical protein